MRRAQLFGALLSLVLCPIIGLADEFSARQVHETMVEAELRLRALGIDARGYSALSPPSVEFLASDHVLLQGQDGAYVSGHVYLREHAPAACTSLNLLHEIVHDATVRMRFFASVSDFEIRPVMEALADKVTESAAENPYRPRCLPRRTTDYSTEDLIALAVSPPR